MYHFLVTLSGLIATASAALRGPSAPGYTKHVGFYCPVEHAADVSEEAFPENFAACINACSKNATCSGVNFEMSLKAGDMSTCQFVKMPGCRNADQMQPGGADKVYFAKGSTSCERSNAGNDYIVAFMANRPQQPRKMNLEIYVAQHTKKTMQIVMEVPALSNDSSLDTSTARNSKSSKTVLQNTPTRFELAPIWKMTDVMKTKAKKVGAAIVEKKAIKLYSEDGGKFYVVGANKEHFTGDAFLGVPVSSLGRRYFAACFSPPFYACEFAVAASDTTGPTIVNITLPDNDTVRLGPDAAKPKTRTCKVQMEDLSIYSNGETFSVVLRPFEVLQVQDSCDLTGTLIEASKPVAVFSGNVRTNVGDGTDSRDHLVEQLMPTSTWGFDCAGAPTPGRSVGDYWSVTASQAGTKVEIWSNAKSKDVVDLATPGSSFRFKAPSYSNLYFKATKPIQVISFVHSQIIPEEQADPSMTVCTPTAQYDYGYTFVTPTELGTSYRSFMTILIEDGHQDDLRLDGHKLISPDWLEVPNTKMVAADFELPPTGVHTIENANKAIRFGAYIYGAGDRASFAFPLGTCANQLTCDATPMQVSDGIDNDCDTLVDEEICGDGIDDDNDGRVDEDCYVARVKPNSEILTLGNMKLSQKTDVMRIRAKAAVVGPLPTPTLSSLAPEITPEPTVDQCLDVRSVIGCYNAKVAIECSAPDNRIKILSAHFGRVGHRDEFTCNSANPLDDNGRDVQCGFRDVYWSIAQQCDYQSACSFHVHLYELGDLQPTNNHACQLCIQYVNVHYICAATAAHERLTLSGRIGAESSNRYWSSSFALGSSLAGSTCPQNAPKQSFNSEVTGPASARFSSGASQAWCPAFCDRQDGWLVVDLGGYYEVSGYMVQGRRSEEQWVSTIRLAYSSDASKWTEIRYPNGTWIHFPANFDARSIQACDLSSHAIVARFMRVFIGSYSGQPCLHIDFFRKNQQMGCQPKTIKNSNIQDEPGRRGTSLTVQCKPGWRTVLNETSYSIKCGATSGQWESEPRPCSELVSCSDIPAVDGALHNGQHTRPGSRVEYTCTGGRSMIGNSTIFCGTDGEWQPNVPKCTY